MAQILDYTIQNDLQVQYLRDEKGIKTFGKKIRSIREEKKMSQQQLAHKAEIEVMQLSRMERGVINTSLSHILNIAKALEICPSLFFHIDDENRLS